MKRAIVLCTVWLMFGLATSSFAQGVQTGTIRGIVKDQQDLPVPGVMVTVTSPSMQGSRFAVTEATGGYTLPHLPAGVYDVVFELNGFATVMQRTSVLLGLTVEQNITMRAAGVAETVQVVGEKPAPIATPVVGQNLRHDEVDQLAASRTLFGIAQLAPALTTNSPNTGQVVINGSIAFDNVFMVNGVDVNDPFFGSPFNLFVEDAIEETQVLTSGISAEYGRFGGGVVNAITRSGSNRFSGSGRVNFSNPRWATETPFEVSKGITHEDVLSKTYEGTFGGPIVRDRLWFFTSGRYASINAPFTLPVIGIQLPQIDTNKRGEVKLTGTLAQNHTIQGGFLNDPRTITNTSGLPDSFLIDPHVVVDFSYPDWYYYTNYKGILKNNLLVEAQYSHRHFQFNQTGPSGSSILDSPFLDTSFSYNYNAPYFDATDPESRNNSQLTGNVSKYWDRGGRHETKGGFEWFRSQDIGGNSQSPTQEVFVTDFLTDANGSPVLDPTRGRPIPLFIPGVSYVENFNATKGAVINIDSSSLFLQDHWTLNGRWSADLGARFEHVNAASTGGIVSISTNRIVPRLAVSFAPKGNGDHVIHVSYSQYSGAYNQNLIGKNSPVGNPSEVDSVYQGPGGQGYDFTPGLTVGNYPITAANVIFLSDALQNVRVVKNTKTPLTHEFSISYGANLMKGRGYGEIAYVARTTHNMIEDYQTLQGGATDVVVHGVDAGLFTNIVYQNTDLAHRQYQGLVFQSRYDIMKNWTVNGHYTLQLKNDGNYEGEGSSMPGRTDLIGNYPEATSAARNYPDGRLQNFQRSRLRIWSIYQQHMGHFGDVSVSGLWRVDSARVYSLAVRNVNPTATQLDILAKAGYVDSAFNQTVFFGDRGSQQFAGFGLLDTSVNYNIPVFRTLRPWVKFDVYNLFNNLKLIAWSTSISENRAAGVDNLGLATSYTQRASFGTATGNTVSNALLNNISAFPVAFPGTSSVGGRTFRISVGVRF